MNDLSKKMARGALWMTLLRMSARGIGLVSTVILARLLVPADFGLIAMATSVIAFLELATAFGFDIPLIQNQRAERRHYDTAWTLNVVFYAGLTALVLALAIPAATFYQDERLTAVIYVLAIGFFARGLQNIGVVKFRKKLDFKRDFLLHFFTKVAGFAVTIPLAFFFRSYWALVAGMVTGNVTSVVLSYALHPFRPRLSFSAAKELLNFSKWLILNNAVNFLRMRSPDFVIGRISGPASLGLFTVAFEIAKLPTTELVAPINRAVFPGYAKLAKDSSALAKSYLDVFALIAFVTLPAAFGISAVAAPLVDVLLGDNWTAAGPLVALLAIFGAVNALSSNNSSVFNAVGKPYIIAAMGLANVSVLLTASITLAVEYGPLGVAAAYVGTSIILAPLGFYLVAKELELKGRDFVRVAWRPLICSMLMYGALFYLGQRLAGTNPFATLGILLLAGALFYPACSLALWVLCGRPPSAEYRLIGWAFDKLSELPRRRRPVTPPAN